MAIGALQSLGTGATLALLAGSTGIGFVAAKLVSPDPVTELSVPEGAALAATVIGLGGLTYPFSMPPAARLGATMIGLAGLGFLALRSDPWFPRTGGGAGRMGR